MSLFPNLVDLPNAVEDIPEPSFHSKYLGKIITYRDFVDYSDTGTVGYPALATQEKGDLFVEKAMELMVQFIKDFKA